MAWEAVVCRARNDYRGARDDHDGKGRKFTGPLHPCDDPVTYPKLKL